MKKGLMTKQQMKAPSKSLQCLCKDKLSSSPYQNLANAIIAVAADDYRLALGENNTELLQDLEQFFHSTWYKVLTRIDGVKLINALKAEMR